MTELHQIVDLYSGSTWENGAWQGHSRLVIDKP
jgi:hypothetical protein